MKIKKEPIREDRYLNLKLDTYPMEFGVLDSIFYDFANFSYCVIINDGEQEILLEYAGSKQDALTKHKEHYERLILRPSQWFDIKSRKFKYLKYKDINIEEKLSDIKTIEVKDLYESFIHDAQQLIVKGSNNGLTFYTKREATKYSRQVAFCIFSGLRVKIGQLRNTSYAELKQTDVKLVDTFVNQTDKSLANRFLTAMYNPKSEEHEEWEMFVDLVEAKISEYFKEGNRTTGEAPNYLILEEILKEIESRVALTRKPKVAGHEAAAGGDKADFTRKVSTNVEGKFYVDDKCIVCDACAATAPKFFKLNEQHAFVTTQPQTQEDIDLCNKALEGCPVAAIGNDGDSAATATVEEVKPVETVVKATVAPKVEVSVTKPEIEVPTVEEQAKELESMKGLLDSVSAEKLAEIRAILQSSALENKPAEQVEPIASVAEPIVEAPPADTGGAKALPKESPDGSAVFPENVAGMFYVDDKCIECDACVGAAPESFVIENGHAYVFAQPKNDQEIADCKEAIAGCPVDAIHINA